jgi:L-histidine N-alpha-methyltransferase
MTEAPDALREAILHEALTGLMSTPRTLPPWLFYDERGSQLFEAITALPEYYLTRTERGIFTRHAPQLTRHLASAVTIAELGAGSASKTGILLNEFANAQQGLLYQPIDISPTALDEAATTIASKIPNVRIEPQVANYITDRYNITRPEDHRVLALYIGSSIGNFSPEESIGILRNLRDHLEPDDTLLLGVDLAPGKHKPVETLLAAYDDEAGVTAAFNKNILTRLNRELNADFNLDGFAHRARWNAAASRMEMHLESLAPQTVNLAGKRIDFTEGETIHTENSYKFTDASILALLNSSGFHLDLTLHDDQHRFAVVLAKAI